MEQQTYKQKDQNTGPNHTRKLGNKQFAMYLKSQPKISTLTYNIEKYLSVYEPFYYNAFLSLIKGRDLDDLERELNDQYNKLIGGKSFLHKINGAIFSRSKCLQKMKRDLTKVQTVLTMFKKSYLRKSNQQDNIYIQYTKEEGYTTVEIDETIEGSIKLINNLFLDMRRFRDMTIYIIENIHKWRVQVEQWMDRCQCHSRVDFYIKNQIEQHGESLRFYDAVRNDTDFLWTSRLSQHIWMQFKNDPLLTRNVVNVYQRREKKILQKYFVQILYPNSQQLIDKTIKTLDMLNHVYNPKQINMYEQEQKLIQNYLGLERRKNEQIGFQQQLDDPRAISFLNNSSIRNKGPRIKKSQSQSKISVKKQFSKEIQADNKKWYENAPFQSPYMTKSQVKKNSNSPKSPKKSPKNAQRENPRGWVFGKQIKSPATDRIREIIKKHQFQMTYMKNHKGIIKPFNITNIAQRKSIALAYLSEKNNPPINRKQNEWIYSQDQRTPKRSRRLKDGFNSAGQSQSTNNPSDNQKKGPEKNRKLYQSLARINSIIQQDPKEHENQQQTPKNRLNKNVQKSGKQEKQIKVNDRFFIQRQKTVKNDLQNKQLSKTIDKKETNKPGRKTLQSRIKINTLINKQAEDITKQGENAQIEVQQQETPLNFKQFFEIFRADTKGKDNAQSRVSNQLFKSNLKKQQIKNIKRSLSIRKIIDRKRSQSLKNPALLPYYSQKKKKIVNKNRKSIQKSKIDQKSQNSFKSYNKVSVQKSQILTDSVQKMQKQKKPIIIDDNQYINLKTRQITKDMITKYILHICSQLPVSCQAFTNYHTQAYLKKIIQTLEDSTVNSLIFDIEAEKDGKIGQAIVIQSLSNTLKMRYTIQFINVHKFQMIVNSVSRISQELLSTSPCQQVILKLVEDKADPVSTHFIALIDSSLKVKAQKFAYFHILQKKLLGLTHQNLHERVYVFQAKGRNLIKEAINQKYKGNWRKRVAGSNYRSLIFETKCVALTSNFKLRSENLNKASIQIYKQQSIGMLYVMLLHKIMTRYHLKQLKIASLSINDVDQTTGMVKRSPFLRSIFYGLFQIMKRTSDEAKGAQISNWIKNSITKFTSMTDLLNYLSYKQYDQAFKFQFLVQSRFILNHQLTLSEINLSTSLDFILQNSFNMLLINNHHRYTIEQISRGGSTELNRSIEQPTNVNGYLLPTTQTNLKIFFMSAKQYFSCSDSLDLFSYIELLFRQSVIKQRHDIEQIAIPDLTKRKNRINNVKMYDGFLRLFPERQFYSASTLKVQNLWQNFYPNAVISMPRKDAIIIQYPIIIGFYDSMLSIPIVSYCLRQEKDKDKDK